jgi:hypothetical protein
VRLQLSPFTSLSTCVHLCPPLSTSSYLYLTLSTSVYLCLPLSTSCRFSSQAHRHNRGGSGKHNASGIHVNMAPSDFHAVIHHFRTGLVHMTGPTMILAIKCGKLWQALRTVCATAAVSWSASQCNQQIWTASCSDGPFCRDVAVCMSHEVAASVALAACGHAACIGIVSLSGSVHIVSSTDCQKCGTHCKKRQQVAKCCLAASAKR